MITWTPEQRMQLWITYLNTPNNKSAYIRASQKTGKTIQACRTEVWKIFRDHRETTQDGVTPYWAHGDRLAIKLEKDSNNEKQWTKRDVEILKEAYNSGVPVWRIAELLGRGKTQLKEKYKEVISRGRKSFFPHLIQLKDRKENSAEKSKPLPLHSPKKKKRKAQSRKEQD